MPDLSCTPASRAEPGLEPFERREDGRPEIPLTPAALYGFGSLIRGCETLILDLFQQNLVSGTTHTCLGQELCQMAVVRTLTDPHDTVWSNHRNHGHFLTHTGDFVGLVAEVMGRAAGVCRGVGGSQHLASRGFHSNGVQGGLTAMAVGHALHARRHHQHGLAAVFIGDGTLGEGLLYESLNLASIWRAPVLFVVEDNGVAQSTPTAGMIGGGSILARGEAFGLRGWCVDDADARIFDRVEQVVQALRADGGPGFLVIETRRLGPHSKGDDLRDAAEMAAIRARDPLTRLGERLTPADKHRIDDANQTFLGVVREMAAASPEARYQTPPRHIFAPTATHAPLAPPAPLVSPRLAASATPAAASVRLSVNQALRQLLAQDDRVLLLGEDLHDPYGGAFKVTAGLSTAFPDRVISTPISEAGCVGAGIGLALAGDRPIVEIMFADFLTLAMDQLLNHAVKFAGMFPDTTVPLVIRTAGGGRRGYGPTHSQSPEALVAGIPGLTVVVPSHRHDPGLLLTRAVCDWPYPTVFVEPKLLYGLACDAGDYDACPTDTRDPAADLFPTLVHHPASRADVALVTYGGMTPTVEAAAARLATEEMSVCIVILSLLAPLPRYTLMRLLPRLASRMVVVEEAHAAHGIGAELGALLLENGYSGRFLRIGTPPIPIPAARSLEADVIPDDDLIVSSVCALFDA
jgi:2-oxoisovalerate dehydrogenase E1 component